MPIALENTHLSQFFYFGSASSRYTYNAPHTHRVGKLVPAAAKMLHAFTLDQVEERERKQAQIF